MGIVVDGGSDFLELTWVVVDRGRLMEVVETRGVDGGGGGG